MLGLEVHPTVGRGGAAGRGNQAGGGGRRQQRRALDLPPGGSPPPRGFRRAVTLSAMPSGLSMRASMAPGAVSSGPTAPPPASPREDQEGPHARVHPVHLELHGPVGRERLPVRVQVRRLRQRLPQRVHPLQPGHRQHRPGGRRQLPRRALGRLERRPHRPRLHGPRRPRRRAGEGVQRDHGALHALPALQQLGGRDLLQPGSRPVHGLRPQPRRRDGGRARQRRDQPDARGDQQGDGLLRRHVRPQDRLPDLRQARGLGEVLRQLRHPLGHGPVRQVRRRARAAGRSSAGTAATKVG